MLLIKSAMIVLPPLLIISVVLYLVDAPWEIAARIAAALSIFFVTIGLCDRMSRLPSSWQEQADAESMASPQESALGLGASAIAGLPVYRYEKKSGGAGDECSICLGEILQKETVKRLPVCTHLFHEGCIDMWLRSHRTCPVCRSPVAVNAATAAPASVEVDVRSLDP